MNDKWDKLIALKYEQYASKYPMYRKTSQFLVKLADIKEGMSVVDLCCGTGIAIKEIIKELGTSGKVIGIDSSKEMLAIAKKKFKQKNVSFIQASGEEADKAIKEKADIVLCNSAFWHMNMDKALHGIKNVLKDDGKFVFNLPNHYIDIDVFINPKRASFFSNMLKAMLEKEIRNNSFRIESYKILELMRTAKDVYEFFKIPITLTFLKQSERANILKEVYRQTDKSKKIKNKWICFVVKKQKIH